MTLENFKINKNSISFDIEDKTVNVLQYLPIEEKNELIHLVLQNANENGYYNPVKVWSLFKLYIVYSYTDIEFTIEEKADPFGTYDVLESNGIINLILDILDENEYRVLSEFFTEAFEKKEKYNNSILGTMTAFIENLAPNAEKAAEIIDKFDPNMFKQVLEFAKAANGGRPIQ